MTENELRNLYVNTAISYLGANEGTAKHREIINLYNTLDPLPRGYPLSYSDPWCAGFTSAMAVKAGLTDIILCECSVPQMVRIWSNIGRFKEDDSYRPQKGDLIIYDWDDTGAGDNTNSPDHIGIVVSVIGSTIKVIEGNYSNTVKYRNIAVNGRYIRGYCLPDYASIATASGTGTYYSGNRYLTMSEMKVNARYIYNYLSARGWTLNAIAAMLGNMQTESTLNPAIWQDLKQNNMKNGYGLAQWTPASAYITWCSDNGYNLAAMDTALKRIEYELENGLQYYPTNTYPMTFSQFKVSTDDPQWLANVFLNNYERPADRTQPQRGEQALFWYDYLRGVLPDEPDPDYPTDPDYPYEPELPQYRPIRAHKMSILLMAEALRRR